MDTKMYVRKHTNSQTDSLARKLKQEKTMGDILKQHLK